MTGLAVRRPPARTPERLRIAVVGAGVSGLVVASRLHPRHEVTVFEAEDYAGGHTRTVPVHLGTGRCAVDTGFIVYNERNYPEFTRLLDGLGVATQPSSMSFSVRCDRTGLEYNGTSFKTLFAQRRNLFRPRFLGMLREILRFNRLAPDAAEGPDGDLTVEEFLVKHRFGPWFRRHYLVPMGASIWSCPPGAFLGFPVRFVVRFFTNHAMLQWQGRPRWRVVTGGSQRYVERLTAPFRDRIRLRTPVASVRRLPDQVLLTTPRDGTRAFDHVVLACHADQALRLLADPSPAERAVLSAFPYQENEAVLHTDPAVLPARRRAWAAWNYHLPADEDRPVALTYHMNVLQSLPTRRPVNVTLNDTGRIRPERIIERLTWHHPVFSLRQAEAHARHGDLLDANRTSYCGAYWGNGFHEDGVRSALAVARAIGARVAA